MPDEAVVPEAPETTGTPTETTAAPPEAPVEAQTETPEGTDWKQRYENLRPEANRWETEAKAGQEFKADLEGRNGPEREAAAAAEVRWELESAEAEEGEPEEEEFDLRDPIEEIDRVRQELAERDQASEELEFNQLEREHIDKTIDFLAEEKGIELTDQERSIIESYGLEHRDPHDGKPDLEGALKSLEASWEAARKRYSDSKTESALAPLGSSGEPKIDMRDKDARQKLGREVFEAHQRSQET